MISLSYFLMATGSVVRMMFFSERSSRPSAVLNSATVFSSATGPLTMRVMALLSDDRLTIARTAITNASRTVQPKAAASLNLIVTRMVEFPFCSLQ